MPKRRNPEDISGSTFADLYDAQERLTRQTSKPMGRPKNKIPRTPTTVYLTKDEMRMLRRLQLTMDEHISSINRSQIVGIAVELMAELVAAHDDAAVLFDGTRTVEGIKRKLKELLLF